MSPEKLKAFIATIPGMPVDKKVKLYLEVRQAKAAEARAFEQKEAEYKAIMQAVENYLLADADRAGTNGFTTDYGTTYTGESVKISIADDAVFETFLRQQENPFLFFERRVSSTQVAAFMKLNEGASPPGLNIFRERVMRVRKASEKSE